MDRGRFTTLIRYRDLLWMLTWRDIRIKYTQSVMGILWAVLIPLMIVSVGVIVRYAFSVASGSPFSQRDIATVSVKSIPWAFLVASLRFTSTSLIANTNLVTKVYMPREIFPLAAVASQFIDLAVASAVLAVLLAIAGIGLSWHLLWVPVLLAVLVLLAVGLGLLAASGCLFFRDVKYLVEVVITFAIFFTPVFYDSAMFGEWASILKLNPAAPILEGLSACVVEHRAPELIWVFYSAAVSTGLCAAAYALFKKVEPMFAECI